MSAEYSVEEVRATKVDLKSGEYDGTTIMIAWIMLEAYANRIEADERARIGWDKECEDVDRIIEKLGLTVEQARTEGGCLHLPRILNHIQETLDALAVADGFGKSMVDKYAAAVYAAKHPPAQAAQVEKVREVIAELRDADSPSPLRFSEWADKLTAALQENAK